MPDNPIDQITETTLNSPADLMDLEELMMSNPDGVYHAWAFRGQPGKYGTLIPSFQRVFHEKKSVPTALLIEYKMIEAFRQHYRDLQDRSTNMPKPEAIDVNRDLKCMSVMQHYGVPTRLLDWTTDFWTAVYFACAGNPNEDAELWYYDRNIFSEQGKWLTGLSQLRSPNDILNDEPFILGLKNMNLIFEFDPKITPRMDQQSAFHTVCTEIFADHATFLTDLHKKNNGKNKETYTFRRLIIAKGCKEKTLKFLDESMKINASNVFPDVEGLGRFLRWQLDSLLTTYF